MLFMLYFCFLCSFIELGQKNTKSQYNMSLKIINGSSFFYKQPKLVSRINVLD